MHVLALFAAGTSKTMVRSSSRLLTTKMVDDRVSSPDLEIIQVKVRADELVLTGLGWFVVPVLPTTYALLVEFISTCVVYLPSVRAFQQIRRWR